MKRLAVVVMLLAISPAASAQECPVVNGFIATISTGDSSRGARARGVDTLLRLDARTAIDTVWRFNITERRWTRPNVIGSVGAGWTSERGLTGTTTAPDRRAWSACASAAVSMRDPTLVLRGARGFVRLRADLTSLKRAGRARADSSQPRR
jgi:hypothetical protein